MLAYVIPILRLFTSCLACLCLPYRRRVRARHVSASLPLLVIVCSSPAFLKTAFSEDNGPWILHLGDFQTSMLIVSQPYGQASWSGGAAWSPTLQWEDLFLRGILGGSILKGTAYDFAMGEAAALFGMSFDDIMSMSAGGGYQIWTDTNTAAPELVSRLDCFIDIPLFSALRFNSVFLTYTHWFLSGRPTEELALGLALRWGH